MSGPPPTRPETQAPDLLAALTAQGLAGVAATPREDDSRREYSRGGWLARWVGTSRWLDRGMLMKCVAGLLDWLSGGIAEGERMRREAYLAQASDHCDLEYRMQALERDAVLARGLW